MCTATWWREPNRRYTLFFNRDELKTRLPALPPKIKKTATGGTNFISPADGDHGGTWLLANEFGLSVGLLNNYAAGNLYSPEHPASRGNLVTSFAGCRTVSDVASRFSATPLNHFRPFYLIAIDPLTSLRQWIWSGPTLPVEDLASPEPPLTTSSYRSAEVCTRRRSRYREMGASPSPDDHVAFHESHDPENTAFSVRMRRPDAQTVSFNRIDVCPDRVTYTYRPESPDSLAMNPSVCVTLPRSRAS